MSKAGLISARIAVFVAVWAACPVIGYIIAWYADPRHDVEWAALAGVAMVVGVLLALLIAYAVLKLTFWPRSSKEKTA